MPHPTILLPSRYLLHFIHFSKPHWNKLQPTGNYDRLYHFIATFTANKRIRFNSGKKCGDFCTYWALSIYNVLNFPPTVGSIDRVWTALLHRAHPLQRKMQRECQCQVCQSYGAVVRSVCLRLVQIIPNLIHFQMWSFGSSRRSKLRAVESSGPQVVMRFSLPPCFYNSHGCTHRHCGVSDCVARRLPYLRRAPRFQQVLGESPGRFGCHLLIWAVTEHNSTW